MGVVAVGVVADQCRADQSRTAVDRNVQTRARATMSAPSRSARPAIAGREADVLTGVRQAAPVCERRGRPPRRISSASSASRRDPAEPDAPRIRVSTNWLPRIPAVDRCRADVCRSRAVGAAPVGDVRRPDDLVARPKDRRSLRDQAQLFGRAARPVIDRRRSSSASSFDAEYASTWDWASSMLTMPWCGPRSTVRVQTGRWRSPENRSAPSPRCSKTWFTNR